MPNEWGFELCRTEAGKIVRGGQAEGGPNAVTIPKGCPAGSQPIGTYHSHPGGVAYPSSQDIETILANGLRYACIGVPETGELACYVFDSIRTSPSTSPN